jgi:hypothetical protein
VGRDGGIYTTDLGSEKQKYFFERGWTTQKHTPSLICPSGQKSPVGWVERFAKPIAVVQNMTGIAEFIVGRAFARPVGSIHPTR